jgi:hypothetical protein
MNASTRATRRLAWLVVVALLLLAGTLAPGADANRKPRPGERKAIYATLAAENLTCSRYQPGSCKLNFRISDVNNRWAAARIRPDVTGENTVMPVTISLHREKRKGRRWKVRDVGNGGGCDVPRRPRRDLNLICLVF